MIHINDHKYLSFFLIQLCLYCDFFSVLMVYSALFLHVICIIQKKKCAKNIWVIYHL